MKNNKAKRQKKTNVDRGGNSQIDLSFFKKKTSAGLSPTTLLAAFFGKLLNRLFNVNMHFSLISVHPFGCLVLSTIKQLCYKKIALSRHQAVYRLAKISRKRFSEAFKHTLIIEGK